MRQRRAGARRLLAHELTHVVQNGHWLSKDSIEIGNLSDRYEQEADNVANSIMHPQSTYYMPAITNANYPKLRRTVSIPDGDVKFSVAASTLMIQY